MEASILFHEIIPVRNFIGVLVSVGMMRQVIELIDIDENEGSIGFKIGMTVLNHMDQRSFRTTCPISTYKSCISLKECFSSADEGLGNTFKKRSTG